MTGDGWDHRQVSIANKPSKLFLVAILRRTDRTC